ncbi:hypothetical protein N184_09620 [Sinorhizobium sp. GL28]|nr:hypothetical protein N183_05430 [Sinorhizobium sp. Sb3]KSV87911.1 hypothetical protein N184_09620 [Sinorhizobium sp. GL28]
MIGLRWTAALAGLPIADDEPIYAVVSKPAG